MQFMLVFNEPVEKSAERHDPQSAPGYWGAWTAYIGEMSQSGIVVSGNGLQGPETSTFVTLRNGKMHVQDGPFADSKERLGGYFIVETPDLDTALAWAAKSPAAAYGSVEVRPVLPPMNNAS